MVVIRMQRSGGRNAAFFRVVVADSRRARDGRFIEKLGYYNPLSQPAQVRIDPERARYWMEKGARPSEAVGVLLKKLGIKGGGAASATEAMSVPAESS